MIDTRYKPSHLPQVSAPFIYVLDKLENEKIKYKMGSTHPSTLKPSQGIVALDKISDIDVDNIRPIWVSNDDYILDGHHRYGAALTHDVPIRYCKIMLNARDGARALNKIQDIFEYEQQIRMEEVVNQDQINAMNDQDSGISPSEFLATLETALEDDDRDVLHSSANDNVVGKKNKTITAYRKGLINDNSNIGNFFSMKPIEGYKKYDIEFDNLLETNDMDAIYQKDTNPVGVIAKKWFPNIDFKKIAKKYKLTSDALINKAVYEKAKELSYDGIKYGDIMVQGF